LLHTAALGKIDKAAVEYNGGSSVCVVAASKGYPDFYEKGFEITGLDELRADILVYHAGQKKLMEKFLLMVEEFLELLLYYPILI